MEHVIIIFLGETMEAIFAAVAFVALFGIWVVLPRKFLRK